MRHIEMVVPQLVEIDKGIFLPVEIGIQQFFQKIGGLAHRGDDDEQRFSAIARDDFLQIADSFRILYRGPAEFEDGDILIEKTVHFSS